jgi:hypothetical protein
MMRETSAAGLVGVVKGDRQARDVGLHLLAQVGDQALRRFREQLRQQKRGDSLHQGCGQNEQHQRLQ